MLTDPKKLDYYDYSYIAKPQAFQPATLGSDVAATYTKNESPVDTMPLSPYISSPAFHLKPRLDAVSSEARFRLFSLSQPTAQPSLSSIQEQFQAYN
jgi:hypothetical protein